MPKIKITFTRKVKQTGVVEVDVDEATVAALRDEPYALDAWARFTMAGQVKEWRPKSVIAPTVEYEAEVNGKPFVGKGRP